MDDHTRQREQDEVDAGIAPQVILGRTADAERKKLEEALAELSASLTDEEISDAYGIDMAAMRRRIDLTGGWSLQ